MDTLFKEVSHINQAIRAYELKDVLSEPQWDKKIASMFEHLDLAVLEKCWTSILYELPITIVMIGDKSDNDKVILDNFREVDAMMSIYGINPRKEKLYLDPISCELALEKGENFVALPDVCDTFKMLNVVGDLMASDLEQNTKEAMIDNLKHVNTKLQRMEILLHNLMVRPYEKSRLVSVLNQFYKDLYAYI